LPVAVRIAAAGAHDFDARRFDELRPSCTNSATISNMKAAAPRSLPAHSVAQVPERFDTRSF